MREQSSFRGFPRRTKSLLVGVLALGLVGFFSGSATTPTEATWTDQEFAGDQFTTLIVPSPTATRDCTYGNGKVQLYWDLPSGYDFSKMRIIASRSVLGSVLEPIDGSLFTAKTVKVGESAYETTMSGDLVRNLLTGLLGLNAVLEFAIITQHETWESVPLKFKASPGLVIGLGAYCDNL